MHFKFSDHHKRLFDNAHANEREVRLGRYSHNAFIPGVQEKDFHRFFSLIASDLTVTGSLDIVYANQTKVVQVLDGVSHECVIEYPWERPRKSDVYLKKTTVEQVNYENFHCRLSLAHEAYFEPSKEDIAALFPDATGHVKNPPVHFRAKKRFSGLIKNAKLELTLSKQGRNIDMLLEAPVVYEIEIEQHQAALADFEFMVDLVLKVWQESPLLLLTYELTVMRKEYKQALQTHLFAGCQPVTLRRSHLNQINTVKYAVTEKWDGRRVLVVVTTQGTQKTGNVFLFLQNGKILKTDLYAKIDKTCVLDAEYMEATRVIGLFDTLVFAGEDLRDIASLEERLACLKQLTFESIENMFSVQTKLYVYTTADMANLVKGDGLIFTPMHLCYPKKKTWDRQYKWKPHNTVDLLHKDSGLYAADGDHDVLFTEKSNDKWPVGVVLELLPDLCTVVRVRSDKTRPNYIGVVRDTLQADQDKITREEIALHDIKKITQMRVFHNGIKRQLLQDYAKQCKRLLDLACGRGGDLSKWAHIEYVEGYDLNAESVNEAIRRNQEQKNRAFFQKDLSVAPLLLSKPFDVVTCNFALHYFLKTEAHFNTFMTTVSHNVKNVFMGCCLDSQRVLKETGWAGHFANDVCQITLGAGHTQGLFGNAIDVQLRHSILNEPTTEYLVDFPQLIQYLKQYNLVLIESKFFDEYPGFEALSPAEQTYSRLNRTFVFVHSKTATVGVLRELLKHKQLKQTGHNKQELLDRLQIHV